MQPDCLGNSRVEEIADGGRDGATLVEPLAQLHVDLVTRYPVTVIEDFRTEDLDGLVRVAPGHASGEAVSPVEQRDVGDAARLAEERQVSWPGADLGALAGLSARIRLVLRDADSFAYQFQE